MEWRFETVEEKGKVLTKHIDLDIDVSVGSGLPKNPAFLWSMLERLSQMLVVDTSEEGQIPKPAVSWVELRDFMKNFLGIPIKSEDQMKEFVEKYKEKQLETMNPAQGGTAGMQGAMPENIPPEQMPNADMIGANAGGNIKRPGKGGRGRPPMGEGEGAY